MSISRREFLGAVAAAGLSLTEWWSLLLSAADRLSLMQPDQAYPVNNAGQMVPGKEGLVSPQQDRTDKLNIGLAIQQELGKKELVAVGRVVNQPVSGNMATPDYVPVSGITKVSVNGDNVMIFDVVAATDGTPLAFSEFNLAVAKPSKKVNPAPKTSIISQLPKQVLWEASRITSLTK